MIDPASSLTSGYHVFFEPSGDANEQLASVIHELSAEYGGPLFQPHVTLLAMIPETDETVLIEKARKLAGRLASFELALVALSAEDKYFRSLYLKAHPSEELLRSRALALEMFALEEVSEYMPHLSLLYGNYDTERKQQSIALLESLLPLSFFAGSVALWKTPGEASTWEKVGEYPFGV